jgi:hypothetical protein
MSTKTQFRLKMALYVALLVLAELLQTAVFGGLRVGPCAMPVAVACISLFEGAQRGSIFGLVGGCLWAWSSALSMYGAWCIVSLTLVGTLAGIITERFLLRGIQTALCISAAALFLTEGLYVLVRAVQGILPLGTFFTLFVPECLLSLVLCLGFYWLTARISQIGGFYG